MSQPLDGLIGQQVAGYQITGLLGLGGMAKVYRAQDLELNREVAIKVLSGIQAGDVGYVERFRDEARRIAALTHPNIVPIYQFGEDRGALFLVMPIVAESLRERLERESTLSIQQAVSVVTQIAGALAYAHEQGIVHRDVKPENIMLSAEGTALLTDFGIARQAEELRQNGPKRTLSPTGLPVGTPEYMAPEQLQERTVDYRADVYALGAVLYELLTGTTPHADNGPYAVAVRVLTEPITPPAQLKPHISPELGRVMLKALALHPEDRYQDMTSFAEALATEGKAPVPYNLVPADVRARAPSSANSPAAASYPESSVRLSDGETTPTQPAFEVFPSAKDRRQRSFPKRFRLAAIALLALLLLGSTTILLINGLGSHQSPLSNFAQGNVAGTSSLDSNPSVTPANQATAVSLQQTATVQADGTPSHTRPHRTPSPGPGAPTATSSAIPTSTATSSATPTSTPVVAQPLQLNPASLIDLSMSGGTCTGVQTIDNINSISVSWQWTNISPPMTNLQFHINSAGWSSGTPSGIVSANSTITLSFMLDCTESQFNTVSMSDDQSNTYTFSAQYP